MKELYIVKTQLHLTSFFLENDYDYIISKSFSNEIIETINSFRKILKNEITYSKLLESISTDIDAKTLNSFSKPVFEFEKSSRITKQFEFSILGDIIYLWPLGYSNPLKFTFFGQICEEIALIDSQTYKKLSTLEYFYLHSNVPKDPILIEDIKVIIGQKNDFKKIVFTNKSTNSIEKYYLNVFVEDTDFKFAPLFMGNLKVFKNYLSNLKSDNYKIILNTNHQEDLGDEFKDLYLEKDNLFKIFGNIDEYTELKSLPAGFESSKHKIAFFTDREIFGNLYLQKIKKTFNLKSNLEKLLNQFEGEIKIDDIVVHEEYGIAMYKGQTQEKIDGLTFEYIILEFSNKDEVFVPINQIEKITRYIGNSSNSKLSSLKSGAWKKIKKETSLEIQKIASELITHYAKISVSKVSPIDNFDSDEYLKFCEDSNLTLTKDQVQALNEILTDLESTKPMNRLLIGDVGFGKTEVALRATFKVVQSSGQVVFMAPTTVLAQAHFQTFQSRFAKYANVQLLSRVNTKIQNEKIIQDANANKVNILIGTHKLLSNKLDLKNLKLIIIDEEQKFGVVQKEKLKKLNYSSHILSISATPIPRTLSMALSSIQELSLISTPPKGRLPIKTFTIQKDWNAIANSILKEIDRGGQVFFVHNRVKSIDKIHERLKFLLPNIKFLVAHGQMNPLEVKSTIAKFENKEADCLICTSIIENGINIQNVNTMIINRANEFGLTQLYQLRGRVGRASRQGYCYLVVPRKKKIKKKELEKKYVQRIDSLLENQDLGSGFRIASNDLDFRGGGEILGKNQHGHIATIGYSMYIEMLAKQIQELKKTMVGE